jgi:tRNA(fMet)-specific endonuclease VapC
VFVFDTDHFQFIQETSGQASSRLFHRMQSYARTDFYLSIISFHEQFLGWHTYIIRAKRTEQVIRGYQKLHAMLNDFACFTILAYDAKAVDIFHTLRKAKVRIGTMDLRIASIALANDFTLLTRNLVDFQQVPGLKVEDWTAGPPR